MSDRPLVARTSLPWTIFLGLLAVATTANAQPTPRDQAHTPRAGTGAIRGRVVRADTGEPLRRVQVHIDEWSAKDQSGPTSTMTDAQGRYELTQLPAGTYHLKATRGGYVEVGYGQRRPFERGPPAAELFSMPKRLRQISGPLRYLSWRRCWIIRPAAWVRPADRLLRVTTGVSSCTDSGDVGSFVPVHQPKIGR